MEFSLNQHYKLNRFLLSTIGLWPYQSATNARIRRTLATSIVIWTLFIQVAKICTSELTTDFIFDVLPFIMPTCGAISQLAHHILNNNKMRDLLDRIKADWERKKSQDEVKIMQAYATSARIITIMFSLYTTVYVSVYIFITFLPQVLDVLLPLNQTRLREHPFRAEFFIDEEKYFYIIRLEIYSALVIVLIIYLASSTMFIVYMHHASGMFAVLGHLRADSSESNGTDTAFTGAVLELHRAERLFSSDEHSVKTRSIRETGNDYKSIVLFVEDHRNTIQFTDIIQSSYSRTIFCEWLGLVILMAFTMAEITMFTGLLDRLFRSIGYVIAQLFYLFMCSYVGQHLIDTSTQISIMAYYGQWHNISLWKQKIMLFVTMRCMRAVSITACDMYVMCLENFSTIVQSAISTYTMLRRM